MSRCTFTQSIIGLLAFSFLFTPCFSQQPISSVDSLLLQYSDINLSIEERGLAMEQFIKNKYLYTNPDTAEILANELSEFFKSEGDLAGDLKAQNIIAVSYAVRGDLAAAREVFVQNLVTSRLHNFDLVTAYAYNNIGNCDYLLGHYVSAYKHFSKGLSIYKTLIDPCTVDCEVIDKSTVSAYYNVMSSLMQIDELEKTRVYKNEVEAALANGTLQTYDTNLYYNIAQYHDRIENLDSALYIFNAKLLNDVSKIKKSYLGETYRFASKLHYKKGQLDTAGVYLEKSKKVYDESNDKTGQAQYYIDKASLFIKRDQQNLARSVLNKADEIATEIKSPIVKSRIYEVKSDLFRSENNYQKAFYNLNKFHEIQDSIKQQDEREFFLSVEEKYDYESDIAKQNLSLKINTQKLKQTKSYLIFAISGLILFSIFSYLLYRLNRRLSTTQSSLLNRTKELEQKETIIKEQYDLLAESNENLENFATIAAHDIKSPINTISNFSNVLYQSYSDEMSTTHKTMFDFILSDTQRLRTMIDDILIFSNLTSKLPEKSEVNLHSVIDIVWTQLNSKREGNSANIHKQISSLPTLITHESLWRQLFLNLIGNSIKFSKLDSDNTISLDWKELSENYLEFTLSDLGVGIPEKMLPDIFGMFSKYYSQKHVKGSGIGLATCEKIVTFFGGEISADSIEGNGTTITFTIEVNPLGNNVYQVLTRDQVKALSKD